MRQNSNRGCTDDRIFWDPSRKRRRTEVSRLPSIRASVGFISSEARSWRSNQPPAATVPIKQKGAAVRATPIMPSVSELNTLATDARAQRPSPLGQTTPRSISTFVISRFEASDLSVTTSSSCWSGPPDARRSSIEEDALSRDGWFLVGRDPEEIVTERHRATDR